MVNPAHTRAECTNCATGGPISPSWPTGYGRSRAQLSAMHHLGSVWAAARPTPGRGWAGGAGVIHRPGQLPPGCATACDRLRHADVGPHNGTQSSRPSGPPPRRMRCPLATALPGAERGHIVPPGSPRRMGCGSRGRVSTARGFGGTPQRHLGSGACRFTSGCPESGRIAAGTRDRPGGCCLQRCTSTGSGDRSVRRLAAKHG